MRNVVEIFAALAVLVATPALAAPPEKSWGAATPRSWEAIMLTGMCRSEASTACWLSVRNSMV